LIYKRTSVFMLPVNIFGEHIVAVLSFLNKWGAVVVVIVW
jgi:hypothetical protein